ncbi:MAG TPA: hypothetical protein VKT81_11565 [Bryobacteraceae bacterium]|nr:hypothetical protein [Bryobacteraceae bacterium]
MSQLTIGKKLTIGASRQSAVAGQELSSQSEAVRGIVVRLEAMLGTLR